MFSKIQFMTQADGQSREEYVRQSLEITMKMPDDPDFDVLFSAMLGFILSLHRLHIAYGGSGLKLDGDIRRLIHGTVDIPIEETVIKESSVREAIEEFCEVKQIRSEILYMLKEEFGDDFEFGYPFYAALSFLFEHYSDSLLGLPSDKYSK